MYAKQTVLVASASSKYVPHAHFTSGTHPRAQGLTRPRWPRWRCSYLPPVPPRTEIRLSLCHSLGFPCSSVGKDSDCSTEDPGSIPVSGRSPGEGNGNPLQYSCLENPMDRGAWQATVHGIPRVGQDLATKPPQCHSLQNIYFSNPLVWNLTLRNEITAPSPFPAPTSEPLSHAYFLPPLLITTLLCSPPPTS